MDLHHPFIAEFPGHSETILLLKSADGTFCEQFEEYHKLDDEICRIEENMEYATDQHLEEIKFKRAKLKDALYASVKKHAAIAIQ
jgi:uncharacterized protein YdcH (DUF465 family)